MWDTTCGICQRPFWKHVWWSSNQCPHHGLQQGLWQGWPSKITLQAPRIWYYRPDSSMDPAVVTLHNPGRCCGWGAVWPSPSVLGSPPRLCAVSMPVPFLLSHMPHCFEGVRMRFINRPWAIHVLVMNIHNPFMHCVTSQYVFKQRDVIMLLRVFTIVAA